MSNNPLLHYKPGLTMDTPVAVEMAAADWAILMAWFSGLPDEAEIGIKHIVYGVMSQQIADALYTQASMQAAKAHHAERREEANPIRQIFGQMGLVPTVPDADDFSQPTIFADSDERWLIMCEVCGDKDEYRPQYTGPLACGHNAGRSVTEIRIKPKEQ